MRVEYSSNNSGGGWWLEDRHWKKLEKAGWFVMWGGLYFCGAECPFDSPPPGKPTCDKGKKCNGHRKYDSFAEADAGERWLGAAAKEAHKDFPSLADAIREWEKVTGLDAADEGCNCCGPPHNFSTREPYEYASGDEVVRVLYGDDAPKTLREAAKRLRGELR